MGDKFPGGTTCHARKYAERVNNRSTRKQSDQVGYTKFTAANIGLENIYLPRIIGAVDD